MIHLQEETSMDLESEDWDDSDFDEEPIAHNQSSIKIYKFLPTPKLKLTGRSSTLNPIDKSDKSDRVSRGSTFPLGRPKLAPGSDQNWDFYAYRFKLSDIPSGDGALQLNRRYRGRTSTGHSKLAGLGSSFDLDQDYFGYKSCSASGDKSRCLPPLGSESADMTSLDPDNTVSPAMLRDILESEGVSKTTINQVVREQSEKRSASFMAEDHFRRLAVPNSANSTRLKPMRGENGNREASPKFPGCWNEGLSTNRLSPILTTHPRLSPPSPRWERSKSFDETTELNCGHRDLGTWRTQREGRLRPWAADTSPRHTPRGSRSDMEHFGTEYGEKTKDKVDSYTLEIERTRWLSELQLERTFYRKGAQLPRIILVSSKVPKASQIVKIIKQEKHLLYVPYDFDLLTFDEILAKVKSALQVYRSGCKAKSILLICQGGPGYIYLLKRKVVTPQKLTNPANRDVMNFWCSLADCLTKMDPDGAAIHILGCCVVGNKQGEELIANLQKLVSSSNIVVENPLEIASKGNKTIEIYFDMRRFKIWRMSQHTSVDSIKFDSVDDTMAKGESSKLPTLIASHEIISASTALIASTVL